MAIVSWRRRPGSVGWWSASAAPKGVTSIKRDISIHS